MRAFLIACLSVATIAVAQTQARPPAAQGPQDVLVDSVVATINDSSILYSEVRTAAAGDIRRLQQERGSVPPAVVEQVRKQQLGSLVRKYQLAQSAKTLGLAPPEQVEAWFRSELERTKQEQIRDLGSYTEFGRALKDQGRTWQTVEREQRIEVMHDIARGLTVGQRLQQANLVTPRMMREAFQEAKGLFQHAAFARVTMLVFTGPDAAAVASEAAAAWATSPLPSRDMAGKFKGSRPLPELDANDLDAQFAAVQRFALEGPEQRVATPIELNGSLYVAKITEFHAASNGQFEDAAVQEKLRLLLDRVLSEEFMREAQERANVRTEVWISELLGGNPTGARPRR